MQSRKQEPACSWKNEQVSNNPEFGCLAAHETQHVQFLFSRNEKRLTQKCEEQKRHSQVVLRRNCGRHRGFGCLSTLRRANSAFTRASFSYFELTLAAVTRTALFFICFCLGKAIVVLCTIGVRHKGAPFTVFALMDDIAAVLVAVDLVLVFFFFKSFFFH